MAKYSKINYIDPNELIPYEKNTKKHPHGQIEKLSRLIDNYGFPESKAILVDEDKVVVAGHGRRLAAIASGLATVPYQIVTDCSDADIKAMRIADNAVAESDWDYELLKEEYQDLELEDYDLELLSLDDTHLETIELIKEVNYDDDAVLDFEEAFDKVKEGDKTPFTQMTFTVHDSQKDIVDDALSLAKLDKCYDDTDNSNSNGNALYIIAQAYLNHVS